jgi:hypothetical protein
MTTDVADPVTAKQLCTVVDAAGADDHQPGENREAVAHGLCWKHLQRRYRGQPLTGREPDPAVADQLAHLRATHGRLAPADTRVDDALEGLRVTARLAYADGLSLAQVGALTGRGAPAVQKWVPRTLTGQRKVRRGQFGGDRATPEKVDAWRPVLAEAARKVEEARDVRREVRHLLREQITAAMADTNPSRVGLEQIAAALAVAVTTVSEWLHPRTRSKRGKRDAVQRCEGRKKDGRRCGAYARHHHRTCFHHRDQEA